MARAVATTIPTIGATIFAVHVSGIKCATSVVKEGDPEAEIVYSIFDFFISPLIVTLYESTRKIELLGKKHPHKKN